VSKNQSAYDHFTEISVRRDFDGCARMVASGLVFDVDSGTRVRVTNAGLITSEIRILDGRHKDRKGIVAAEFLSSLPSYVDRKTDNTENEQPPAKPTEIAATWHEVARFKSDAAKEKTDSFCVPDYVWQIRWNTKPKSSVDGSFVFDVKNKSDDSTVAVLGNVMGVGKDWSPIRGAGHFYLAIRSTQDFEIVVETKH
jgi:hypothetical protein